MSESRPYRPIDCEFHDVLEARATTGQPVEVIYRSQGEDRRTTAKIEDVYVRDGAEYVLLGDKSEVRLDELVSVDGIDLPESERIAE